MKFCGLLRERHFLYHVTPTDLFMSRKVVNEVSMETHPVQSQVFLSDLGDRQPMLFGVADNDGQKMCRQDQQGVPDL